MPHSADAPEIARNDAANMAKLRKSLKQRQRRAMKMREQVTKLTPSEIRALNSTVASSGESLSRQGSTSSQRRHATPPDSPTDDQARQSRTSTSCLPTPPQSPKPQLPGSRSSLNLGHQPLQGYVHHSRPHETKRSDMLNANGFSTRRWSNASASSASIRSLPMYRGHEMTHAGSMNMLRRPSLDIVNNPLSMFSRPRQAIVNSAPDPRRTFPDLDPWEAQVMLDSAEAEEREAMRHEIEQLRISRTVSPVSMEEVKTPDAERFPFIEPEGGAEESQGQVGVSPIKSVGYPVVQPRQTPASLQPESEAGSIRPAAVADKTEDVRRKTHRKRFSLHSVFSEKKDSIPAVVDKRRRRRTVAFNEPTDTITSLGKYGADAVVGEKQAPSPGSSDGEMTPHPAVRPHSIASLSEVSSSTAGSCEHTNGHVNVFAPTVEKIKALTPLSIPKTPAVYGRCKCCGKLKRPATFSAELSPVLENENLRTNFSFEIERSRASLDSTTSKRYTPIIPIEVLDNSGEGGVKMVQASIEPPLKRDEPESPLKQDVLEPRPGSRSRRESEEARLVRFASLHGLNVEFGQDDDGDDRNDEVEVEVVSTPIVDPLINPRGYMPMQSVSHEWLESNESLETLSTMSIATARPVSMVALKRPTMDPKPATAAVDDRFTITPSEVSSGQVSSPRPRSTLVDERVTIPPSEASSQQTSRPRPWSTLVDERVTIPPSEASSQQTSRPRPWSTLVDERVTIPPSEASSQQTSRPRPRSTLVDERVTISPSEASSQQTSRPRPRSTLVEEWYMNAIREGPKQDIITVVGWDHHKTGKGEAEAGEKNNHRNARLARPPMKVWPVPETRMQGGRSSFEALVAVGNRRHSSTSLASPAKEKDVNKRRSMLLGLFSKTNSHSTANSPAKSDDDNTSWAETSPTGFVAHTPGHQTNDSAISMSSGGGGAAVIQIHTGLSSKALHDLVEEDKEIATLSKR
ncbi:hypothetical protein DV736_g6240, partial [Chaetothyriales sp. CBS 134916]